MSDKKKKAGGKKEVKPVDPAKSVETTRPQPSKAELKRLRRQKQEAQRAAKAISKQDASGSNPVQKPANEEERKKSSETIEVRPPQEKPVTVDIKLDLIPVNRVPDQQCANVQTSQQLEKILQKQHQNQVQKSSTKKVTLFNHLPQFVKDWVFNEKLGVHENIDLCILNLGVQYALGLICGSNARCIALLDVLRDLLVFHPIPNRKDLARELDAYLRPNIGFLNQCRPLSVSMRNAIKHVKWHINHVPSDLSETKAKDYLFEVVTNFVKEKILLAKRAISQDFADKKKIQDGDVLMIYGYSSLIKYVLCDAIKMDIKFRVIVADSRPKLEGREMMKQLVRAGIECSYVYITAVSYVMREVTKVLLGAHALLSNGFVMSRVGTSQIALVAKAYNIPVMVCCETYKFSDNVQTDSFVTNELADPNELIKNSSELLKSRQSLTSLNVLNLVYDVTPPDLVTIVVTEIGMIPCTSVPVVLRVKSASTHESINGLHAKIK